VKGLQVAKDKEAQALSAQELAKEREILETLKHNDWSAFSSLLAEDAIAIDEDGIIGKKEHRRNQDGWDCLLGLQDGKCQGDTSGQRSNRGVQGDFGWHSERKAVYVAHLHPFALGTAWGQVANDDVSGLDGERMKSVIEKFREEYATLTMTG
jgi:hypothetical protein